jgi:hypothetical protein
MKHQEPRVLGLCMELRINHSFERNTAGSSCAAWPLIPVDTAHPSSQRTWRREQYSLRGTVRLQVQVQFLPEKAEEYYFDLWCTSRIFQWCDLWLSLLYMAELVIKMHRYVAWLEAESKAKYLLGLEVVISKLDWLIDGYCSEHKAEWLITENRTWRISLVPGDEIGLH